MSFIELPKEGEESELSSSPFAVAREAKMKKRFISSTLTKKIKWWVALLIFLLFSSLIILLETLIIK